MGNLRFVLASIALFCGAFVGVSWASKGFPAVGLRASPMKPDARVPTFEEAVQEVRREIENPKPLPADNDPGRNQMRLTTIQAANAYALSPCDQTVKAAFVVAASTYMRATAKSESNARAFSTAMDARVRTAIEAAFDAGGITTQDFPAGTPLWGQAVMNESIPAQCGAGRQAERRAQ